MAESTTAKTSKQPQGEAGDATLIDGGVRDHRDVSEGVAGRIGLDMVVNCVLSGRRQIAGLFVGDFIKAHRAGARFAQRAYGTHIPNRLRQEADLLVCNAYPMDADPIQGDKALWAVPYFEREPYRIVLNAASDGISYHGLGQQLPWSLYLKRRAAAATPDPQAVVDGPGSLLVLSEQFQAAEFSTRHCGDLLFRSWETLIEQLAAKLPADATAVVFPSASTQILAREELVAVGETAAARG